MTTNTDDSKRKNDNNNNNNKKRKKRYSRKNSTPVVKEVNKDSSTNNIIIRFPPLLQNSITDTFESPEEIDNVSKYFDNINDDDLLIVDKEINSIDDLIELGKSYKKSDDKKYTLDLETLHKLVEPLENLQRMVGMKSVKETIVNLILYNIQNFEKRNSSMLHTIIEGSPGTGKTEVAKIIGDIYLKMGILKNNKFKSVKRNDLIGQYLGHTANKTQEAIDSAKGGVLFIDEAYSLGNPEGRDSYSKECIDIINQNLSEGKGDFVCIIAGYSDALKKSFFSYNEGLERRFPYRFKIDDYEEEELQQIYMKIVNENKWKFKENYTPPIEFFKNNIKYFKFFGGDLENFFNCCRIAHARRAMTIHPKYKKCLTDIDLNKGLEFFINNDEIKKRNEECNPSLEFMYT
jgi:SpoVK/Ycf46/Vps4 family AAA+-type ATPase